jgi:hypothetical protein
MKIRKLFQRKIARILEINSDMNREIINVYKGNQTLCHQRGAYQKLNTDIKRRIDELTLSDQENAHIIEHESGIIVSMC